ncbi:hypothetical protein [Burkholderia gladioli]|uniref:hypothetical protein n=1 Tax=Burkholderia gladioli TaxID=28095 RepID=UPI00164220AD|nr:hypothetical protein [Burkholderia gladioli]
MKIAGWEVPPALICILEKRMRERSFDASELRGAAWSSGLLPKSHVIDHAYIQDEIGTRIIAKYSREKKIVRAFGRSWCWRIE